MRKWIPILFVFLFTFYTGFLYAQEDDDNPPPLSTLMLNAEQPLPDLTQPAWDETGTLMPMNWTTLHYHMISGPHEIFVGSSLNAYPESTDPGEEMLTGAYRSSVTYRYNGLFGGYIRPVGRVSLGAGQNWGAPGGLGFNGYRSMLDTYASTEAGVEVLFPVGSHRIGVGATYGYHWTFDPYGTDDITGPAMPRSNLDALRNWHYSFYPIFE